jgi:hypothetical protein
VSLPNISRKGTLEGLGRLVFEEELASSVLPFGFPRSLSLAAANGPTGQTNRADIVPKEQRNNPENEEKKKKKKDLGDKTTSR